MSLLRNDLVRLARSCSTIPILVSSCRWSHDVIDRGYTIAYQTRLAGPPGLTQKELQAARKSPDFYFDVADSLTTAQRSKKFFDDMDISEAKHIAAADMWRSVIKYVGIPSIIICGLLCYFVDEGEPPPYIPYEYMGSTRPYPWGKEPLFGIPKGQPGSTK